MKKILFVLSAGISIASCKLFPGENKKISDPLNTSYHLHLNPKPGSHYYYDVSNRTETHVELEGQEIDNSNTTTVGITYSIEKDTGANYVFKMGYDKAHILTKTGDNETEMDAMNAKFSLNPAERMLGALKNASLVVSVSPNGNAKIVSGYKELSQQLMQGLDSNNINAREVAQKQLDKIIGEGIIQKNLDQLFNMFPDSTIRIGDKWKIDSKQNGDFNLNITTFYELKDISDNIALINSESDIASDNTPIAMMGYSVIPNLKGTQEGKYEVNTKTGMLMKETVQSEIKGNVQMAGREVPIKIKVKVEIDGRKTE